MARFSWVCHPHAYLARKLTGKAGGRLVPRIRTALRLPDWDGGVDEDEVGLEIISDLVFNTHPSKLPASVTFATTRQYVLDGLS